MRIEIDRFLGWKNIHLLGGMLYTFFLPFNQTFVSILIVLWLILSLISKGRRATKKPLLLIPVGLYIIYIFSLFLSYGGNIGVLERKLTLIVFPLIFFIRHYKRSDRELLLRSMILGLAFSGIVCFILAFLRSSQWIGGEFLFNPAILEGKEFFESILYGGNHFFGRNFSKFHQTVYYAFYLCAGISILLFYKEVFKSQHVRWGLIGYFILLIFLISNKGSFIALALLLVLFILRNTQGVVKKATLIALLVLGLFCVIKVNPRLNEAYNKIVQGDFELNKNARYGFSTRLLSWDASINLIKQNPILGYGVANTQDSLDQEYKKQGYRYPLRDHLNTHNQFLQFWLESGLLGVICWSLIFIFIFIQSSHFTEVNRYFVYSFMLILFVNSLFESVMNRFSGVSFISFFLCFILSNVTKKQLD